MNATGCRSCDYLALTYGAAGCCAEHAYQMALDAMHARLDRYMEATLGMRLHLMALAHDRGDITAGRMTPANLACYQRWAYLFHANTRG